MPRPGVVGDLDSQHGAVVLGIIELATPIDLPDPALVLAVADDPVVPARLVATKVLTPLQPSHDGSVLVSPIGYLLDGRSAAKAAAGFVRYNGDTGGPFTSDDTRTSST